ncbi:pilin [Candidatus Gracilibacteria bacterium]|nr:pilin [Candidatus Gracilibacteria bacterium]
MKKILVIGLVLFSSLGGVSIEVHGLDPKIHLATDKGYSIREALTSENIGFVKEDEFPKHLPGIFKNSKGDVSDLTSIMQKFANGLAGIAAAVAVLFIIYNCFNLVTAAGESDKISKAKKGLIWSLVGLVLIMGAYIMTKTIIAITYSGS